jgi:glycosyltransferase involved in cell wall biosynthesis
MGIRVPVVLPAYNEAENLVELVPEIIDGLCGAGISSEVIVIDDGGNDGTPTVLSDLRV